MSSCIPELDAALFDRGVRPGTIVEVCGRASAGKTSLALGAIEHARSSGLDPEIVGPVTISPPQHVRQAGAPPDADALAGVESVVTVDFADAKRSSWGFCLATAFETIENHSRRFVVLDVSRSERGGFDLELWNKLARAALEHSAQVIVLTECFEASTPASIRVTVQRAGFRLVPMRTLPIALGGARLRVDVDDRTDPSQTPRSASIHVERTTVLRLIEPRQEIRTWMRLGKLTAFACVGGPILTARLLLGPRPTRADHLDLYEVATTDHGLYALVRDSKLDRWYLAGICD